MRFLARPPALDINSSFAEAHEAGRFGQLELITQGDTEREAKKLGLTVTEELLEVLDREGVFRPVAFTRGHSYRLISSSRWATEDLVFRDMEPFRTWSRYRVREDGRPRVTALYSPWQLMYLKSALEERECTISVSLLKARWERLRKSLAAYRRVARSHRELIASLEMHWRPVVLLLCWLQNRYLPYVLGRTTLVFDPEISKTVDPLPDERREFDHELLLTRLGITTEHVRRVYEQLALIGRTRDPIEDWYLVIRAARHKGHEKFEGDARLAHLIYDAAEVLRRFLADATGEVPPDCNNLFRSPTDWTEKWLGHERRVYYDRADFKKILESRGLSPHGVHVFVEGESDIDLIGGLIDHLWGSYRALGVRFTSLGGIGEVSRQRTLFDAFSSYARKAILVADDEGKIARDVERLRSDGLLVNEDEIHLWRRNIEEDSTSLAELIGFATELAKEKGRDLGLSEVKLKRIMKESGGRKGAAQTIIDFAEQRDIRLSKRTLAKAIRTKIIEELEPLDNEQGINELAERRAVLGLAISIGRYSGST
ncbi:MAG: hypothetical protein ABSC51_01565 [Gaiellaceae bacterium]|jgi:hypothetical protein